jgi:hypothetical protein
LAPPPDSLRLLPPPALQAKLAAHPLSRDLYPTSMGHYRRAHGHQMSRDRHDDHLLIYCSEGGADLQVQSASGPQDFRVGCGDLILAAAGHGPCVPRRRRAALEHFLGAPGAMAPPAAPGRRLRQRAAAPLGVQHALLNGFAQLLEARHSGYRFQPFLLAASRLRALLCQLPAGARCARAG